MTRVWGCPSGAMVATVETTLSLIGDKWKALILRDLMPGTKRFGELKKSVGNVSQKVLTAQLRAMEESGLVHREVYAEVPPRVEYSQTNGMCRRSTKNPQPLQSRGEAVDFFSFLRMSP